MEILEKDFKELMSGGWSVDNFIDKYKIKRKKCDVEKDVFVNEKKEYLSQSDFANIYFNVDTLLHYLQRQKINGVNQLQIELYVQDVNTEANQCSIQVVMMNVDAGFESDEKYRQRIEKEYLANEKATYLRLKAKYEKE